MKFQKIKINDQDHRLHISIPCGMWIEVEGIEIPVALNGDFLVNRVTASNEAYPEVKIDLGKEGGERILSLFQEEKTPPRIYIPGVGWIENIIENSLNEKFKILEDLEEKERR